MENLFASDTLGIIVRSISAVIVAVITYVVGPVIVERIRKPKNGKRSEEPSPKGPSPLVQIILAGISAALTFIVVGFAYDALSPKPSVAITSPTAGQQIEASTLESTGAGSFTVVGTSKHVFADPDLRVYVLVHPAEPFASGWWIQQPAPVAQNGQWSTQAWIGNTNFPPHQGDEIDLMVVAAAPESVAGRTHVDDQKDLNPAAQSDVVRVSIGSLE